MNQAQRLVYWLDKWTHFFSYSQHKRVLWFKAKFPIEDWLQNTQLLLDIGCGTGALTSLMAADNNRKVIGIDIENLLTERYRDTAQVHYALADGSNLPFTDASFERVTLFWVLHHACNPEQIIAEAKRVLAHHGRLIIVEDIVSRQTRLEHVLVRLYDSLLNFEARHSQQKNKSLSEWKEMLTKSGDLTILNSELLFSYRAIPFLKFGVLVAEKA